MKTFDKKYKSILYYIAIFYVAIPFIASLPTTIINGGGMFGIPIATLIVYVIFHFMCKPNKNDYKNGMTVNGIALLVLTVIFTVMLYIADGTISGSVMEYFNAFIFPFAPSMICFYVLGTNDALYVAVFLSFFIGFVFCAVNARSLKIKRIILPALCIILCLCSCTHLYLNRPEVKYSGHGFDYMNGYSSTDFKDYTVYAENSKLVTLNHTPSFVIENEEDMPVLDGAEACYPLYAAFAKAVYRDIDKIEKSSSGNEEYTDTNGKIVTFTNTIYGFDRLVDREVFNSSCDMFFGAKPSQDQLDFARECGVDVEVTPIGKEAFVFFVEEDNPIDNLTSDELRKIYHGDIENWEELGGKNQKIIAFQRPDDSGSQTMMKYFMQDVPLKEPLQYETISAMEGVINEVAQYNNEDGAIGYTFRYFLEGLHQEKGVKMLSVDGVYPTVESVEDGSYPITVPLCLVTRKNNSNPNVQKMKEFILSDDGQYIIHETGYGRLNNQ